MADLSDTDHSESACYLLPEIPPGQLVVLPGQCDLNITVGDFNASQVCNLLTSQTESFGSILTVVFLCLWNCNSQTGKLYPEFLCI